MSDLISALRNALGADAVLTGDDLHGRASGIWRPDGIRARALVRPRDTAGVSRALALCHAHGQGVVAHGGLTGLAGGALTSPGEIVISLERLNRIEEISAVDRTMTVQAGVVLQAVQEQAEAAGLMFPLDLGGRGSATIGGNIATNAGGNRVIRYGMARDMVLGLEAVLADGTVLSSMNRMIKNNAGYDLKQLFIGSEGSLGIVTRAVLRLREKPRSVETLLVAVDGFAQLGRFLKSMDAALGGTLSAFEVLWSDFYALVTTPPAKNPAPLPQGHAYYVLVEAMGGDPERDRERIEAAVGQALEEGLVADAVVAGSEAQRQQLWALRDDVGQTRRFGPAFLFDVSLRISEMEAYVDEVHRRLAGRYPGGRLFTFGHLGDGNLHFMIAVGDGGDVAREAVEHCVYEPLAAIEGSVSGEHGIGLEKKAYLTLCRSPAEMALMRALKAALDPRHILNPRKVFDRDGAG